MIEESRVEQVLRAVLAERATAVAPPSDLEFRARRHNRIRTRLLVAAAAAAVVLVGAGIPAGLTALRADAPPVTPAPSCPPRPAVSPTASPGPTGPLPRRTGVRGSLAGDPALVDAVLAVGYQGLRTELRGAAWDRDLDAGTVRVRFVERVGDGVLALVTGADTTGRWQAGQWVVQERGRLWPAGVSAGFQGPVRDQRLSGRLFTGDDPLVLDSVAVCGQRYGVVLASPGATAELTAPPTVTAVGQVADPPAESLPLVGGLAVVGLHGWGDFRVSVTRGGEVLGYSTFRDPSPRPPATAPPADQVTRAIRDAAGEADPDLAEQVVRVNSHYVRRMTTDEVTGVRVIWGGNLRNGDPVVLSALTLPSGAQSIVAGRRDAHGGVSTLIGGFHPARDVGATVFAWRDHDYVVVVALGAARAEVVQPGGVVLPVPLTEGGGSLVVLSRAQTLVRAYAADDSLIDEQPAGHGRLFTP